jgi:hypothetical protein
MVIVEENIDHYFRHNLQAICIVSVCSLQAYAAFRFMLELISTRNTHFRSYIFNLLLLKIPQCELFNLREFLFYIFSQDLRHNQFAFQRQF